MRFLLILVVCAVVAVLIILGLREREISGGFNPDAWLAKYQNIAEPYAEKASADFRAPVPDELKIFRRLSGVGWVSFTIRQGDFLNTSYGMAYSSETNKPSAPLGEKRQIIRWENVVGNWYFWVSNNSK